MGSELNRVVKEINNNFGEGTLCLASEAKTLPVKRLLWGIFSLDCEIGGGVPLGRVIQLHGPYSSGKTTLALYLAKNVQQLAKQKMVAWVDTEGVFDIEWAKQMGINLDKLLICRPQTGQRGLDIAEEVVKTHECGLLVIDSIANITPKEEIENAMEDQQIGLLARIVNKFIRKVTMALQPEGLIDEKMRNDCIILLLNQERSTINPYQPKTTPGGRGKDFASSVTIELRRGSWISEGTGEDKDIVGQEIYFKVEKNKTAPPQRTGLFDFYFKNTDSFKIGEIDNNKSILNYAIQHTVIQRSGSFYIFEGKKWQGKDAAIEYFKHHPEDFQKVKDRVLQLYSITNISVLEDKNDKSKDNV
jgi:recombination protein RecA